MSRLAPWVGPPGPSTGVLRRRPAFQMCLARAVTGPERFKGGTCSFGVPRALSASAAGNSPARIQAAGMQLARTSSHGARGDGRATGGAESVRRGGGNGPRAGGNRPSSRPENVAPRWPNKGEPSFVNPLDATDGAMQGNGRLWASNGGVTPVKQGVAPDGRMCTEGACSVHRHL